MKFLLMTLWCLCFSTLACAELNLRSFEKSPKSETAIKSLTSLWTKSQLETTLRDFISSSKPSRLVGTEGNLKAKNFIIERIKKADPKNTGKLSVDEFVPDLARAQVFYQKDYQEALKFPQDPSFLRWTNFTKDMLLFLEQSKNLKGSNIVWEKKGFINPEQMLVVIANYDTLVIDSKTYKINQKAKMPGADSNGSGVAVALSLIEVLSSIDIPKTVSVIFTDFDEIAFSGTWAYLQKNKEVLKTYKNISAISLAMLGYDSKSRDKEQKFGNMSIYLRKPEDLGQNLDAKLVKQLSSKNWDETVRFKVIPNSFNSSGHSLFWEQGYGAVIFTQNWESDLNPNEHTSEDIVETLNMSTLYGSYRYVTGAVIGWALDL